MKPPKTHPPRLILASTSPYRRMLLKRLGLPFETVAPEVDETPFPLESPEALAVRLSILKSKAGALGRSDGLIIGSDQVACLGKILIGKPGTPEKALQQLKSASGQTLTFYTGLAMTDAASMDTETALDVTRVTFRALTDDMILRYLDRETPYDCAGSFKAEGHGITLMERIESEDPTGLIGLPLIALTKLLNQFGMTLP